MKSPLNSAIKSLFVISLAIVAIGISSCSPSASSSSTGSGSSSASGSGSSGSTRKKVAFVPNLPASFWNIAKVGCMDAGEEFDLKVDFRVPSEANAVEQKRVVEDVLASGAQAIAISPVDASNQTEELNKWAAKVPLLTTDSDAPKSNRLMFIGPDNYKAGRQCGKLVKSALPDGGNVIICVGNLSQDNARLRRQGVIDELLDRDTQPEEIDPTEEKIEGKKFTVLTTLLDLGKQDDAKRKAADAITANQDDLHAMIGLFAYNPPAILQALKQAGKENKIKVIAFDEDEETLQGIKDGLVIGTVVQDPYNYGFKSVEVMNALINGDKSVIPDSKFINVPTKVITNINIDEFWDDLKSKMSSQ